jgi:hypothetical protein
MPAKWLEYGLPPLAVAGLVLVLLAAVAYIAASSPRSGAVGYTTVIAKETGCTVLTARSRNVISCQRLEPGVYDVRFSRSLSTKSVLAGRGSCCVGEVGASVVSDRTVRVALERFERYPVEVTVLIP